MHTYVIDITNRSAFCNWEQYFILSLLDVRAINIVYA